MGKLTLIISLENILQNFRYFLNHPGYHWVIWEFTFAFCFLLFIIICVSDVCCGSPAVFCHKSGESCSFSYNSKAWPCPLTCSFLKFWLGHCQGVNLLQDYHVYLCSWISSAGSASSDEVGEKVSDSDSEDEEEEGDGVKRRARRSKKSEDNARGKNGWKSCSFSCLFFCFMCLLLHLSVLFLFYFRGVADVRKTLRHINYVKWGWGGLWWLFFQNLNGAEKHKRCSNSLTDSTTMTIIAKTGPDAGATNREVGQCLGHLWFANSDTCIWPSPTSTLDSVFTAIICSKPVR